VILSGGEVVLPSQFRGLVEDIEAVSKHQSGIFLTLSLLWTSTLWTELASVVGEFAQTVSDLDSL
jgi:hypothetical protein